MATIHVDGKEYEVDGADNLLSACLSLGLNVPYFCWHPALGSVGACRQCAVKQYANADDSRGRLVMSCMTPAADNSYISIDDEEARQFRASVIEWLMINHPHDCPVCEEGGNCHLQDMTVMTGHDRRRYRFTKRTHPNQELGPFIGHEMNRCIACYRCVRYYRDYAEGEDFGVYGAHDNLYFGRLEEGVLENEFSGNLVEVCPTGVFTDKTHSARYNRKWDMQFAPSVCQHCAVGCNISPGERYGELRRVENRYNGAVNHYFLCDRGRFGHGHVNSAERPRTPLLRQGDALVSATIDTALTTAGEALRHVRRIIGIGSPRASVEANFALRELVGADNFSVGMADQEWRVVRKILDVLGSTTAEIPTLREMEERDAVFILGEDVTQTAPRIALALRQATKGKARALAAAKKAFVWQDEAIRNIGQQARHPLIVTGVIESRLDDAASELHRDTPEALAQLGFAVAHAIDAEAPAVALAPEQLERAQRIAATLLAAERPLLVSGSSLGCEALIDATANIATALRRQGRAAAITLVVPEVNTLGVAMLGGVSVDVALAELQQGAADGLIVLENDLYRRVDAATVDAALDSARMVVTVDHQLTATVARSQVTLPAASFAEGDGTVVSQEGRAQRFFQVYDPGYYNLASQLKESWRWLEGLHSVIGGELPGWDLLDQITAACAAKVPALRRISEAAPDANFRVAGRKIARQPLRYSGRTAMRANLSVHEPRASQDGDSALTFSMEGYGGPAEPGALIPFAWAPGWNSPQSWTRFQDEVGGHLRGGDGGVRLFEASTPQVGEYFREQPVLPISAEGRFRLLPLYHIFGSEELSIRAPAVASRAPQPYLAVAQADASRLGIAEADQVEVTIGTRLLRLPARVSATLVAGTVGLPAGLTGLPPLPALGWSELKRLEAGKVATA
ncbi:MAG TPA: NADH-quinone oxidoreductase subunit NuoG [Pseudomonadales bacterium]|nr:NADH-quinone oxidoreductase subunit NuoG [Pseudomonadales bacterium]